MAVRCTACSMIRQHHLSGDIMDLRNAVWEKSEENMRLMEDLEKERFEKMEKQKLQEKIDIQAAEIKTLS